MRALAQHDGALAHCVRARLLRSADAPTALVRLLAAAPWYRTVTRSTGTVAQCFADGAWSDAIAAAQQGLHNAEAQAWLALVALLTEGGDGGSCCATASRARALAGARRLLTPRVLNALPPLVWLQRAAEHEGDAPREDRDTSVLLVHSLPPWRDALLASTDWDAVVASASTGVFGNTSAAAVAAAREATAAAALWEQALVPPDDSPAAAAWPDALAAPPASVRIEFARKTGATWVLACELVLLLDATHPAKDVSVGGDNVTAPVRGRRWRLLPPAAAKRMPPMTRVRCQLGGADTLLELPAPAVARGMDAVEEAWSAAPGVVWVTLGSLVLDGFALQLRMARVESPEAAGIDGPSGMAMLYRAAGGALTLRQPQLGGLRNDPLGSSHIESTM